MAREQTLNDDAPELTDAELAEMLPARAVLTPDEFAAVKSVGTARIGRPPAEVRKIPVTIRLDPDIVAAFKATGDGWQSRMNAALRVAARDITSSESA